MLSRRGLKFSQQETSLTRPDSRLLPRGRSTRSQRDVYLSSSCKTTALLLLQGLSRVSLVHRMSVTAVQARAATRTVTALCSIKHRPATSEATCARQRHTKPRCQIQVEVFLRSGIARSCQHAIKIANSSRNSKNCGSSNRAHNPPPPAPPHSSCIHTNLPENGGKSCKSLLDDIHDTAS